MFMKMMEYQGEVKMMLLRYGMTQQTAHKLAGDIADLTFKSELVTEECREIYSAQEKGE